MTERIYYRPIQPGAYYPTIPRIEPPASWSDRKRAMYRFNVLVRRLPRTEPGWYLRMSKSYPKETA